MLARVQRTIRQHRLIARGDRVAVALSGGPDSVALAWILRELAAPLAFELAGLIHVHHGLRGAEADRDEAFARALAARLVLPIDVGHFDVGAEAEAAGHSIEVAARHARYRFFPEAAEAQRATRIATGHTRDDQAETVLLRLLRGAGGRGAAGIPFSRDAYIRPLLECGRDELRAFLAARGEAFCEDSSNLDRSIPRNRVRHELLPEFERIAPGAARALARFAGLAADDETYLQQGAIELARTLVLSDRDGVQVQGEALSGLHPALARRVIRIAAEQVAPGIALEAAHIEAVRELARGSGESSHLDLPGVVVERESGMLRVAACPACPERGRGERSRGATRHPRVEGFEYGLSLPGSVVVPEARLVLTAECSTQAGELDSGKGARAVLQAATFEGPLVVRNRRDGDRLRPLGAPGRRKLQDLLVDRKVPRAARDRTPVVTDAAGRIVWVVGVAMADECRVTAPEAGVVILQVKTT